jgi:hypothetical protein
MNVNNFISSDWESKLSQWQFLYSKLPYQLFYAWQVIEIIARASVQRIPTSERTCRDEWGSRHSAGVRLCCREA